MRCIFKILSRIVRIFFDHYRHTHNSVSLERNDQIVLDRYFERPLRRTVAVAQCSNGSVARWQCDDNRAGHHARLILSLHFQLI